MTWDAEQFWRAPDGCVLGLDMRGLPDQGMRGGYGDWPYAYILSEQQTGHGFIGLGEGRVDEVRPTDQAIKDAWLSCFGSSPIGDTLLDWFWNLATQQAVVDGTQPLKPLMPTREGDVELYLPLHSLVRRVPFGTWNPTGNVYHNRVRDLLRADLQRHDDENKAEAKSLKALEQELRRQGKTKDADKVAARAVIVENHAESVLDAMCRKYSCDPLELSATIKRGRAQTTISDTFSASLTGWTTVTGGWATRDAGGGDYRAGSTSATSAMRHDTALSDDDHYSQAVVFYTGSTAVFYGNGPAIRFSSSALTCYYCQPEPDSYGQFGYYKHVTGTSSRLTGQTNRAFSSGQVIKFNVSGSTLTGYSNGVASSDLTDTAISGNLQTGIITRQTYASYGLEFDDFYATDGIAEGHPAIKRFGGIPFAAVNRGVW